MLVKKITKSIVILTIAAGLFLLGNKLVEWMNHSTTLRLSDVDVEGNRLVTTDEILKLAPVRKGQNITGIDLLDIQKAIEVHPYIETALISRRFPSTLRIDIVERVPVAFLNGTHLFAVDETGFLLPRLKSVALHGLPIITGIDNFRENPGAMVESDRVIQAINLFNLIRSVDSGLYQNLSEVHYDNRKGFLVNFNDARFPAYFGFGGFYEKARKLQAFFARVKEEKRYGSLKYVDLRFREQVVAKF